jgi:hypothetical protein
MAFRGYEGATLSEQLLTPKQLLVAFVSRDAIETRIEKTWGAAEGTITPYRRSPPGVTPACSSSRYPP